MLELNLIIFWDPIDSQSINNPNMNLDPDPSGLVTLPPSSSSSSAPDTVNVSSLAVRNKDLKIRQFILCHTCRPSAVAATLCCPEWGLDSCAVIGPFPALRLISVSISVSVGGLLTRPFAGS